MKKSFIAFWLAALVLIPGALGAAVFTDVSTSHPNYPAINYLYEKGVIQGYADNTFKPDQPVNRAEALKIILLGSDVLVTDIAPQTIFPDVSYDSWYGKYVAKAKRIGIVSGDGDTGLFRPGDTINLAEILKILLKTNNITVTPSTSNPYPDVPASEWYAPYFYYAWQFGLLDTASNQNVYPAQPVTRGMMAELMYRLSDDAKNATTGKASYYGAAFHGRTTASGEIFDASALTAAHRTYPFGTWVRVINAENGKSVIVKINDRGPYGDAERIIDLSKVAFESIAALSRGIIYVSIEQVDGPDAVAPVATAPVTPAVSADCVDAKNADTIEINTFEKITLESPIATHFLESEVIRFKGSATTTESKVSVFLVDDASKQTVFTGDLSAGKFDIPVRFSIPGAYQLGILTGESGTSVVEPIKVFSAECLDATTDPTLAPIPALNVALEKGDTVLSWDPLNFTAFKLRLMQGTKEKTFYLQQTNSWKPTYRDFADFQAGQVRASIQGTLSATGTLLSSSQIVWGPSTDNGFVATLHTSWIHKPNAITLKTLTQTVKTPGTLQLTFTPNVPIRSKAALILPNGTVTEVTLSSSSGSPLKNANGVEVFVPSNQTLSLSYATTQVGTHFLEINDDEGLAALNVPIYVENTFPLIPDLYDLSERKDTDLGSDLTALSSTMFSLVNQDRQAYGLPPLKLDNSLSKLGQARADDMMANQYFGHWDKNGLSVNDLRKNYGILTSISENLAKEVNLELGQYGLMRSAIHRANILSDEWTRAGFGIKKDNDGTYVIVQLFSTDPIDLSDLPALQQTLTSAINEKRGTALILRDNLNTLAQNWSVRMADEDFFDFTAPDGSTLVATIRAAGITSSLGTYIAGNGSFTDALTQISSNAQIQEARWKNLGVGLKQDSVGIIKFTVIYTE